VLSHQTPTRATVLVTVVKIR